MNLKINTSAQLEEDRKTGFVFGFGYTIKDSNFLKKKKKKSRSSRSSKKDNKADGAIDPNDSRTRSRRGSNVNSTRGSDMTFMLDFTYNDNSFFVHELDTRSVGDDEQTRGSKGFQISPSVDYNLNENLTLRAFLDYNTNTPYGVNSFLMRTVAGGITVRLNLN